MDKELTKRIILLYCEWCPHDCQGYTEEEKLGCLASSGFAEVAIPIIQKAEREEITRKMEECLSLAPHNDSYLRILVRDTIDDIVTGKTRKQRADEWQQALKGETKECPYKTIRDWPDCFEDCDFAGKDECPKHKGETDDKPTD